MIDRLILNRNVCFSTRGRTQSNPIERTHFHRNQLGNELIKLPGCGLYDSHPYGHRFIEYPHFPLLPIVRLIGPHSITGSWGHNCVDTYVIKHSQSFHSDIETISNRLRGINTVGRYVQPPVDIASKGKIASLRKCSVICCFCWRPLPCGSFHR